MPCGYSALHLLHEVFDSLWIRFQTLLLHFKPPLIPIFLLLGDYQPYFCVSILFKTDYNKRKIMDLYSRQKIINYQIQQNYGALQKAPLNYKFGLENIFNSPENKSQTDEACKRFFFSQRRKASASCLRP